MMKPLLRRFRTGLKIYKVKVRQPFTLYKKLSGVKGNLKTDLLNKSKNESWKSKIFRWIRANLFVPDARRGFIAGIVKEGKQIAAYENPDLIFSSSPPHSVQLGAKKLAGQTNLKWVADLRDPWTDGFWQKDLNRLKFIEQLDERFELSILKNADHIISVSEPIVESFNKKAENNYSVIPNGYDEEDFNNLPGKVESKKFKITYAGSLRESQIPYKLFDAIDLLVEKNKVSNIELIFFGSVHKDAVEYITKLKSENVS